MTPERDGSSEELVGLWSTYFTTYTGTGNGWVTAVPVTMRNTSGKPITIESISFDELHDIEVAEVEMFGPQDPALANVVYSGWLTPDLEQIRATHTLEGLTEPVAGYVIPSGDATSATELAGPDGLLSDAPNDASPAFRMRRVGADKGIARGLTVRFSIDGKARTAEYPDAMIVLCEKSGTEGTVCSP